MRLRILPATLAGILLGLPLAQSTTARTQTTATISGALTDPSGAAISGAKIEARQLDSQGQPVVTQSGPDGKFSLTLDPGRYRVTVEHPSFVRAEQEFALTAGETKTWDLRLALEQLSEKVVVTASAIPETLEETVVPVDIITREQIDEQQEIWLTPMLAEEPGAAFSRLGPMGGITTFFLDGGNSNYTKVLVDGVPMNEPGGAIDLSNLTLDDVDKIEIVHGASSALYGSDAMAGVVQIFTHRGTTGVPQLTLESDGGTFGTGRGSGQLSGLVGPFDYSAGAAYFTSDGPANAPFMGEPLLDYYRDTTLSGNFGWKISDTDSVRLALRNNASDGGQPGQTLLEDQSVFAVDPGQHSELHDFSADLAWNFTTGENWRHQVSGFESRFQDTDVSPPFGAFVDKDNRAGFEEQSTYLFHNGGITAGYEYEVEIGQTETRHNQAGYLEARRQFGRRLTVVAGARAEANGFFGTRVVPRAGASYALRYGKGFWGATRLRSSYGEGIKEPEILPPDCSPQLAPEQSTTVDAGIDQFFASDRVRLSVTYFHNDFRNIVSFTSAGPENCPAFGGSFFNTDLGRAYGVNSSFEAKATRWLSVNGNYSYDDSRVLESPNATDPALVPGNRLFKRPLNAANLTFNAHFRQINWNFSGHYVGPRTDSDFLGLGIKSDPGYVSWDMAMIVPIRYRLSATAYFGNLFNNHYQDAVGYPALGYNYRIGIRYVLGGAR